MGEDRSSTAAAFGFGGWRHRASQFYLLIIVFAFPLFSLPCRKGTCSSPVEIVACSLISNAAPEGIVKALLYPGLMFSKVESTVADNEGFSFPAWNTVLAQKDMSRKQMEQNVPTFKVVIEVGCYVCIFGAVFAITGQMTVSACGMLILLWYIYTLGGEHGDVFALPMFGLAMFCSIAGLINIEGVFRKQEARKESKQRTVEKSKKQS